MHLRGPARVLLQACKKERTEMKPHAKIYTTSSIWQPICECTFNENLAGHKAYEQAHQ